MIASGLPNNTVVAADGRKLLMRGRVRRDVMAYNERDDKGVKYADRAVAENT